MAKGYDPYNKSVTKSPKPAYPNPSPAKELPPLNLSPLKKIPPPKVGDPFDNPSANEDFGPDGWPKGIGPGAKDFYKKAKKNPPKKK